MEDTKASTNELSEFWKEFKLDDDGDSDPSNLLHICESSNLKLGTAGRIYDCSMILGKYLLHQNYEGNLRLKGKRVLELGCGTGSLAIMLASIGCHVIASDLELARNLVDKNIAANQYAISQQGGSVKFQSLDWNQSEERIVDILRKIILEPIDYVVAADTCFNSNAIQQFFKTLDQVKKYCLSSPGAEIFVAYKLRLHEDINDEPITQILKEYQFEGQRVHKSEMDENYKQKDIEIFRLSFEKE